MSRQAALFEGILGWISGLRRTYAAARKLERCGPTEIRPLLREFADADTAARVATRSGTVRNRLLRRMMAAVGVDYSAVESHAPTQLLRLQRACLWCDSAERCRRDLDQHQINGRCPAYCANTEIINRLDKNTAARWPADSRAP